MKRKETITELHKISLADLQTKIHATEGALHDLRLRIAFGHTKETHKVRQLRRDLARQLTIAAARLANTEKESV